MVTSTRTTSREVWMQLTEAGRKRLAKLMVIQDISARALAAQAGWQSHTILLRLLSGEQSTLTPDRAVAIAATLGVGVDDLFVPRMSTAPGRTVTRKSTPKGRAA